MLEKEIAHLSRWFFLTAMFWTLLLMGSLLWAIAVENEHTTREAVIEARASLNKDKAFRLWGASHGGVYVPVDARTPPNSRLKHLPERDLETPSGRQLTLMNPSYMIRQVMGEYEGAQGVKGKITTFPDKLFNPANRPDSWELEALKAFEKGAEEVLETSEINAIAYMRLMQPLFIKQKCLKCHASQGYQLGELGGGIGVAVPMASYLANETKITGMLCFSYSLIWLTGLGTMFYVFRLFNKRAIERMKLTSRLQRLNVKLEKFSYQDGLTNVANRRMFDTIFQREWATAKREKHQLSLIMIDIDYFKYYNDGYGHQAGDDCLKRIATTLNTVSKRTTDLVARYGGEEFVLLLPNTDEEQALRLAESCRSNIEALKIPHAYSDAADVVSISLGVTTMWAATDVNASALIKAADEALYRAKKGGRNRVEVS